MRKNAIVLALLLCASGLVGCAAEPHPTVPPEANQVVKGGRSISFRAPHDGRVYLRDESKDSLVYSTDIRRGQDFRLDPSGQVTLDGKSAGDPVPNPGHRHSIFFEPSDREDLADRPTDTQ
jgi:hypothetical protein